MCRESPWTVRDTFLTLQGHSRDSMLRAVGLTFKKSQDDGDSRKSTWEPRMQRKKAEKKKTFQNHFAKPPPNTVKYRKFPQIVLQNVSVRETVLNCIFFFFSLYVSDPPLCYKQLVTLQRGSPRLRVSYVFVNLEFGMNPPPTLYLVSA